MSSASVELFASSILAMNAGEKLSDEQVGALRALLSMAASAPAAVAPAVKKPAAKKATKAVVAASAADDEAALLAPVDAVAAPAHLPVPAAAAAEGEFIEIAVGDRLRDHKHRLCRASVKLCMGRKVDEDAPLEGTRKEDAGSNGKFFPEKQCSKAPMAGSKLCKICAAKDAEVKADPKATPKGWYGRLDEPMFGKAFVVGCEWFYAKYPNGLTCDPSTAPAAAAAPAAPAAAEKKKRAPAAKKVAAADAVADAMPAPANEMVAAPAEAPAKKVVKKAAKAVAANVAPVAVEWITFLHEGRPLIRNAKTGMVYEVDSSKHTPEEMAQKDKVAGKWVDGKLDEYAVEED